MKKSKLLALLLVLVMVVGLVSACNGGGGDDAAPTETPPPAETTTETTDTGDDDTAPPAESGSDLYEYRYYMNYDWYPSQVWGDDLTTAYWSELFNIKPVISKPDANEDELLTLMVTSGDFPDAIWMDRNDWNRRLARDGYFVDLDTLKPLLDNNWYDDNILQQTQEHLKIDGTLYGVPNWARRDASGGNNCWMYTQSIWEAVGSPEITTFDDLYNYAVAVRDNVTDNHGQPVIPFISESTGQLLGELFVNAIYRSFGGAHTDGWWGVVGGDYLPLIYDPVYQDALVEANKWFREDLFSPAMLTDTRDQFLEKLSSARAGLIWYDHSQDDTNDFRKIVRSSYPGESIEIFTFEGDGMTRLYPPANGLAPSRIYGEHYDTIGWNVTCIFNNATQPERIFELMTYLLTKQGSIEMMYGPQGQVLDDGTTLWDDFDSNGNPILNFNPEDFPDRISTLGLWDWAIAGHADNVDHTKFAVNDALPEAERSWVINHQAHVFTPLMRPLTDEYSNIHAIIAPDTPLQHARTANFEFLVEKFPQIIMADSETIARALINEVIDFFEANDIDQIIIEHDKAYQANLEMQGGSIFTR